MTARDRVKRVPKGPDAAHARISNASAAKENAFLERKNTTCSDNHALLWVIPLRFGLVPPSRKN